MYINFDSTCCKPHQCWLILCHCSTSQEILNSLHDSLLLSLTFSHQFLLALQIHASFDDLGLQGQTSFNKKWNWTKQKNRMISRFSLPLSNLMGGGGDFSNNNNGVWSESTLSGLNPRCVHFTNKQKQMTSKSHTVLYYILKILPSILRPLTHVCAHAHTRLRYTLMYLRQAGDIWKW